jgi:hypothetical protein
MTKKHFIALADASREHNSKAHARLPFTNSHLDALADFCKSQNGRFDRSRWLGYIAGENGPNGGSIRKASAGGV